MSLNNKINTKEKTEELKLRTAKSEVFVRELKKEGMAGEIQAYFSRGEKGKKSSWDSLKYLLVREVACACSPYYLGGVLQPKV